VEVWVDREWVLSYIAADGRDQVSGIQSVPAAGKPGGLPASVVIREQRSANAEQARQDCRAVGSNRERSSRQAAGADLVRYDTDGKQVRYWLKHKRDTSKLLKALETIVQSSSKLT
jgi:hypothetical protein